eukprot:3186255-Prymnesium_polylepis.1
MDYARVCTGRGLVGDAWRCAGMRVWLYYFPCGFTTAKGSIEGEHTPYASAKGEYAALAELRSITPPPRVWALPQPLAAPTTAERSLRATIEA